MPRQISAAVVGATGNVGSQVVRRLLADPSVSRVVGLCRRPPEDPGPDDRLGYAAIDIADRRHAKRLAECFEDVDVVIHLAWLIQPSHDLGLLRRVNVDGTRMVVDAALGTRVPSLVYASSVGAYGPSDKQPPRDESWPTTGIQTSTYSRHKAEVERLFDTVEAEHPDLRVVRIRPALVFQRQAASEIVRYFLGPLVPARLLRRSLIPVVPDMPGLRFQVVHAEDLADAFARAALGDARGAYNVATDPVFDARLLGETLHAKVVRVPVRLVRAVLTAGWRLRLVPTDAGWLDMGLQTPVMDTSRARAELGWTPTHDAPHTLLELIDGMSQRAGGPTPPLAPRG